MPSHISIEISYQKYPKIYKYVYEIVEGKH